MLPLFPLCYLISRKKKYLFSQGKLVSALFKETGARVTKGATFIQCTDMTVFSSLRTLITSLVITNDCVLMIGVLHYYIGYENQWKTCELTCECSVIQDPPVQKKTVNFAWAQFVYKSQISDPVKKYGCFPNKFLHRFWTLWKLRPVHRFSKLHTLWKKEKTYEFLNFTGFLPWFLPVVKQADFQEAKIRDHKSVQSVVHFVLFVLFEHV